MIQEVETVCAKALGWEGVLEGLKGTGAERDEEGA